MTRAPSTPQGLALRARIVLAAGQGISNQEIAARLNVTASTVGKWRAAFHRYGISGIRDRERQGRPAKHSAQVWEEFRRLLSQRPPGGKQRWTVRALADQLGLPRTTVHEMLLLERGKLRRQPTKRR
jgi:transposase